MGNQERQTTHHIMADKAGLILKDSHNYSFYRLVEHLYRLHDEDIEDMGLSSSVFQRVIMEGDARLGFPASDVISAKQLRAWDTCFDGISTQDTETLEELDEQTQYKIKTTFLSLQGPDSPLPGYYLDQLAYDYSHEIGIRAAFFDFFNNRLLTLLNVAWRKYRYYKRFQHSATDGFSKYIFALIGLGDKNLRIQTPIPWSRLLSFVGIIVSRSRSPSVVSGIVAHCFDLEKVSVREFEQRYVDIPAQQRNGLGRKNASLGKDFVLGARVSTRASKFTIVISELTQKRFRDFLPNGESFKPLCKLIEFLLRDTLAYDLELGLKQEEIPPFQLAKNSGIYIGWTTFLPQDAPLRRESVVRIKARS